MEQKNHGSPSFINIATLLLFAIVIAVVSAVTTYFVLNSRSNEQYSPSQSSVIPLPQTYVQPTSLPVEITAVQTKTGFIEGSLSYPSEELPPQKICAENINTQQEYCSSSNIENDKYTSGKGYRLEVPEGNYYVYAFLEPNPNSLGTPRLSIYKAYYSEFVTCGSSINCPSHQSIVVKVFSGKTTNNIDPQDWYKPDE